MSASEELRQEPAAAPRIKWMRNNVAAYFSLFLRMPRPLPPRWKYWKKISVISSSPISR